MITVQSLKTSFNVTIMQCIAKVIPFRNFKCNVVKTKEEVQLKGCSHALLAKGREQVKVQGKY